MNKILVFFKKQWFLVTMFALIIIASISPNIGKSGGYLHIDQVSNFGIALVFFYTD